MIWLLINDTNFMRNENSNWNCIRKCSSAICSGQQYCCIAFMYMKNLLMGQRFWVHNFGPRSVWTSNLSPRHTYANLFEQKKAPKTCNLTKNGPQTVEWTRQGPQNSLERIFAQQESTCCRSVPRYRPNWTNRYVLANINHNRLECPTQMTGSLVQVLVWWICFNMLSICSFATSGGSKCQKVFTQNILKMCLSQWLLNRLQSSTMK